MLEITTAIEAPAQIALRSALKQLPKLKQSEIDVALAGGELLKLTSKQTNVVVAHVNRFFRSNGFSPITAKELIRTDLKTPPNGCLDPCEGATSERLLGLIGIRFARVGTGV